MMGITVVVLRARVRERRRGEREKQGRCNADFHDSSVQ
jgi:hypothetical protein